MKPDEIESVLDNLASKIKPTPGTPNPQVSVAGDPSPQVIGHTYSNSLDEAANQLLNLLTPAIKEYAIDLCDHVLHLPRWQLLLGALMSTYESGQLAAPSIDPSWREVEVSLGKSVCPICNEEFIPKRYGQLFCETKRPKCGDVARLRDKAERDRQRNLADAKRAQAMLARCRQLVVSGLEDEELN